KTTAETAGTNCANGGTKVETGLDTNSDGTLQVSEVTATNYVCNGTNGSNGTAGSNGTNGNNGQGVPTGGTANQVLAKVNATDYNTQWVTPASGGASASFELFVSKTTAQTTAVGNSNSLPEVIPFESGNNANAALTSGNTFANNNIFTVGTTGAGLYLINVHLTSTITNQNIMIDVNGTGNSGTSLYGGATVTSTPALQTPHQFRSETTHLVWLAAGTTLQVRAASASAAAGTVLNTDGTCYWSIAKLK
ncbi:MAG: hypothetical protein ABI657_16140, partial [Flavobacterium sp.]